MADSWESKLDWNELDFNFETGHIQKDSEYRLSETLRKIDDKIGEYRDIVKEILHPDSDSVSLYESNFLDEQEKEELFQIFRRMMQTVRGNQISLLDMDEQNLVYAINESVSLWKNIKPIIGNYLNKVKDSWERERVNKEKIFYTG